VGPTDDGTHGIERTRAGIVEECTHPCHGFLWALRTCALNEGSLHRQDAEARDTAGCASTSTLQRIVRLCCGAGHGRIDLRQRSAMFGQRVFVVGHLRTHASFHAS
jgi:hypothetical protein